MSGSSSGTIQVEIIQTVPRKRWTSEQKMRMVETTMQPGSSVSRVARENGTSPAMLYKWRRLMLAGGAATVEADDQVVSVAEVKALQKRIMELERSLGRKTLENGILKAAVELGLKKTDTARALVRNRGFRISAVARALSVSRSNIHERPDDPQKSRESYSKQTDCELLQRIIQLVDKRPTYGYRRIWAMLRRQMLEEGLEVVNHKRVYRLMKQHGLLLLNSKPRNYGERTHTGRIVTEASDQRWCSDGFELNVRMAKKQEQSLCLIAVIAR